MTDTETRVRAIVAEQFCVGPDDITPDSRFGADLSADSLDVVELIMLVEESFGTDLDGDDALEAFGVDSTFGQALALVERKTAAVTA